MGFVVLGVVAAVLYNVTRPETKTPTRYVATTQIELPVRVSAREARNIVNAAPADMPASLLNGQTVLALSEPVTSQALKDAGLEPGTPGISFQAALGEGGTSIALSVQTKDPAIGSKVLATYADAFLNARRAVSANAITNQQRDITGTLDSYRRRLGEVEDELHARLGDGPLPTVTVSRDTTTGAASEVSPSDPSLNNLPLDTQQLIYERSELQSSIQNLLAEGADLAVGGNHPQAYASIIESGSPRLIKGKETSTLPMTAGLILGGIILGLLAAIIADRLDHTIRTAKSAARVFQSPVLSTIAPARRGSAFTVLNDPQSDRSEAFRALAATCVATDRLPRAIMVTSPTGDAYEEVAANFAAALAGLGLRVALVATTPDQKWLLKPFKEPAAGATDLPELLSLAHAGRLNGQMQNRLPVAEDAPNLMAVPPGEDASTLPFDGLPPLLDALVRAGFDVAVIAGPALLDSADGTIVAWATRSVLWAVQAGNLNEKDAALAAARIGLAGVEPFGVALIGEES